MSLPPTTKDDFEKLTVALAEEIQSTAIDYRMYEDLAIAADAYPVVIAQSRAFWDMTIQAHLNSAILRLCRVYDKQNSSTNLVKWLKVIKLNTGWFTKEPIDIAELDKDTEYASIKNPAVLNLTKYRGNVLAHLGESYVLDFRGARTSFKLTHGDVKLLLKDGLRIVNHYSSLYNGHSWSPHLVGADDYTFIFRELHNAIERLRAEQEAEIQKHIQQMGKQP